MHNFGFLLPLEDHSCGGVLSLQVGDDPFRVCKVPTIFCVGSEGALSSVKYIEVSVLCIFFNFCLQ